MKIKQSLLGLIINKDMFSTIFFLYILIFFFIPSDTPFIESIPFLIKALIPIILVILSTLRRYIFTYYILHDNHITIAKGIITKYEESIPFKKITSINYNQPIIARIINRFKVRIDTNDTLSDFEQLIVNEEAYLKIKQAKQDYDNKDKVEDKVIEEQLELYTYKATNNNLIKFAFSKVNLIAAIVLLYGAYQVIENFIDTRIINDKFNNFDYSNIVLIGTIIIILIILLICLSILKDFLKYYNYTLTKYKDYFTISYGALTLENHTIQNSTINGIVIKQSIIGRLFKVSEISLVSAGYGLDNEDESNKPYFAIAIKDEDISSFLNETLPQFNNFKKEYKPVFKAYLPNFIIDLLITFTILFIISIFTSINYFILGIIFLFVLIIKTISLTFKTKYNHLAYDQNNLYSSMISLDSLNFTTNRYIIRSTSILKCDMKINPLQHLFNVSSISINNHSDFQDDVDINLVHYQPEVYIKLKEYLITIKK